MTIKRHRSANRRAVKRNWLGNAFTWVFRNPEYSWSGALVILVILVIMLIETGII